MFSQLAINVRHKVCKTYAKLKNKNVCTNKKNDIAVNVFSLKMIYSNTLFMWSHRSHRHAYR